MTATEPIRLLMALTDQRSGTLEELSTRFKSVSELWVLVQAVEHPAVAELHGDDMIVAAAPPRVERIRMESPLLMSLIGLAPSVAFMIPRLVNKYNDMRRVNAEINRAVAESKRAIAEADLRTEAAKVLTEYLKDRGSRVNRKIGRKTVLRALDQAVEGLLVIDHAQSNAPEPPPKATKKNP